jgi:hypothetical protein
MSTTERSICPGCGLQLPRNGRPYDRKFHASAECWAVFEQVLAREYEDTVLFGMVHQLTVDTYVVQHAGGRHPDKSVCVHLVGLLFTQEQGVTPTRVPPLLQRLTQRTRWPHLEPPAERAVLTIQDVALAANRAEHAQRVREWAAAVWRSWDAHHGVARELAGI